METTYYPAGHSMDSQWFAVDKDGHIGFFDTSEEGPLPIMVDNQKNWLEFLYEHSIPIEGKLHKLILPNDTINEIISKCSTDVFGEMISDSKTGEPTFFEGFILLNDNYTWNDIGFQYAINNCGENFALKISEEKELYYLDEIHKNRERFIYAVKNGVIKCAAFAELTNLDNDWEGNKFCIDIFGGFRFGNDDGWGYDPYRLDFIPEKPLHISAFAEGIKDKIPVFENISFRDDVKGHLQALEHLSCHTYTRDVQTPVEFLKMGYNKVKASDNKSEIYCRMASIEFLADRMELSDCAICNSEGKSNYNHCELSSRFDFPPILLLKRAEEKDRWELKSFIEEKVLPLLNIDESDVYSTCCVKCLEDSHNRTEYFSLQKRFQNCHPKLEIECDYLKPILLIGVGKEVFNLLQSVYPISSELFENGNLYEITINGTIFTLLTIDEKLENLSEGQKESIKQTVATKLKNERIIPTYPRVKSL